MAADPILEVDAPSPRKPVAAKNDTPLAKLKERVARKVERPEIFIEVPERAGVYLRVSPNISQDRVRAWRKQAGDNSKEGLDILKFSLLVIGSTTTGILIDEELVTDDNGNPLTFASQEVWEMLDATRSLDAVRNLFGIDFHVEAAAIAIMEQAGLGEEVSTDPSKRA